MFNTSFIAMLTSGRCACYQRRWIHDAQLLESDKRKAQYETNNVCNRAEDSITLGNCIYCQIFLLYISGCNNKRKRNDLDCRNDNLLPASLTRAVPGYLFGSIRIRGTWKGQGFKDEMGHSRYGSRYAMVPGIQHPLGLLILLLLLLFLVPSVLCIYKKMCGSLTFQSFHRTILASQVWHIKITSQLDKTLFSTYAAFILQR